MSSSAQNGGALPLNLPQLQNLIKRDPESYRDEFLQQYKFFESVIKVFELNPKEFNKNLDEIVMFLAQIAKCYPKDLSDFPQKLMDVLRKHSTVLDPDMRLTLCKALILMRNRDLLTPADLITLFFELLKCPDKSLRKFLKDHIVNDIKNANAKRRDVKMNTTLQNFMFKTLEDSHKIAAKTSLDIMIELYRKNVWKDEKTVNVISSACFSDMTKVCVTALKFFMGKDAEEDKDDDSDDEADLPTIKQVAMANKFNSKTKKRERMLANLKKAHAKKKKKEKSEDFNHSALHLLHDPQGLAEKLFKKVDQLKERFEVKVMFLDMISRLIGVHELIVLNFYTYLARFLNPHQREVVSMLQFAAQAAHPLVPADAVEPVVRTIVNNFVTERNSSDVMAIGLNSIRELCKRCPLAMDETLLRDLAGYKSYKDKAVMMAARSLIMLYRNTHPELLHKKDRGRPTEAQAELKRKEFGEHDAPDYVPGADELDEEGKENSDDEAEEDEGSDGEEGWVDVNNDSEGDIEINTDSEDKGEGKEEKVVLTPGERKRKAADITSSRILSDAEFKKLDAINLRKQVQAFRKGGATSAKKQKLNESLETSVTKSTRGELVNLEDIEMIHSKRRHDKEARLATVLAGREGREKFGGKGGKSNKDSGTNNKVKAKNKNFMMLKHKIKKKAKRSFQDKARDLKRSLMRRQKFA